jgi:hypothetical protein
MSIVNTEYTRPGESWIDAIERQLVGIKARHPEWSSMDQRKLAAALARMRPPVETIDDRPADPATVAALRDTLAKIEKLGTKGK